MTDAASVPSAWNLANVLTVLRIAMVPFFAWALLADGGHTTTGRLVATGRLVKGGRTVGLLECDVVDEKDRLVARASSTCMTLRGEQAEGR